MKKQPEIAIIGAGITGLHAAYILKQAGITANVYEGSPRVGGRIASVPEMMGPGLWTEMGGEFIDSAHIPTCLTLQRILISRYWTVNPVRVAT